MDTHLKDPCQDCEGRGDLHSVRVSFINVHRSCPISYIYHKITVWCQPLCHTPNHDADHSECTWTHKTQAHMYTHTHVNAQRRKDESVHSPLLTHMFPPTYGDVPGSTKDEVD